jgi:hypothetical protein
MPTGSSEENIVAKTDQYHIACRLFRPDFEWAIGFDKHLRALFEAEGIEDEDVQSEICEAFCALGLATHRLFVGNSDAVTSQEHCYASTKMMRKLIRDNGVI